MPPECFPKIDGVDWERGLFLGDLGDGNAPWIGGADEADVELKKVFVLFAVFLCVGVEVEVEGRGGDVETKSEMDMLSSCSLSSAVLELAPAPELSRSDVFVFD